MNQKLKCIFIATGQNQSTSNCFWTVFQYHSSDWWRRRTSSYQTLVVVYPMLYI